MAWFQKNFGFKELNYTETRNTFQVSTDKEDNIQLFSKANSKIFHVGRFDLPSVFELRQTLSNFTSTNLQPRSLKFQVIGGDARSLHLDPSNAGSVFQVASQFNCLEMVGPGVRPEDGVTRYASDRTQGPVCAMACPAGTVFRNYFVNGSGQNNGRQLDGSMEIAKVLNNEKNNYWTMSNGYMLSKRKSSIREISELIDNDDDLHNQIIGRLRVGVHWNTEVEQRKNRCGTNSDDNNNNSAVDEVKSTHVCQVFSSAAPISYDKLSRPSDWASFATAILEGTYEATLAVAAVIAEKEQRRVNVFLTSVGGGAFGNSTIWIERALRRALKLYEHYPLDVRLVCYGTKPANQNNKFIVLEKEWKRKRKKKSQNGNGNGKNNGDDEVEKESTKETKK